MADEERQLIVPAGVRLAQRRHNVASHIDEVLHARGLQCGFEFAGPTCQIDMPAPAAPAPSRHRPLQPHKPCRRSTGTRASRRSFEGRRSWSSRLAKPSFVMASMPPASKKFLANSVRAVKSGACRGWRERFRPRAGRGEHAGRRRRAALQTARQGGCAAGRQRELPLPACGQRSAVLSDRTCTALSWILGNSLVPVSASLRRAMFFSRSARTAATLFWISPCSSAAGAAGLLDLLEQRPRGCRKAARSDLDAAGARGGIGTLARFDLLQQNELRVARDAACECIGQAERQVNGSTVIASAPPRPAAKTATVERNMFT